MEKVVVDTQGMVCPAPLIAVRKKIKEVAEGTSIKVIVDNDTSFSNLVNYLAELSITSSSETKDGLHFLSFTTNSVAPKEGEILCPTTPMADSGYVVVVKSEVMGDGDSELGTMLLRGYLNAVAESDKLPKAMVLYNSGVKCAIDGRDTQKALSQIEQLGVAIIICGTCVDYYNVKDQTTIGTISNMYKIAETLSKAGSVVYP